MKKDFLIYIANSKIFIFLTIYYRSHHNYINVTHTKRKKFMFVSFVFYIKNKC